MTVRWKEGRSPRWEKGGREAFEADRAWDRAHPNSDLFFFGRCKSGVRWFWAVRRLQLSILSPQDAQGWEDNEQEALDAARAAVARLADGRPARAVLSHQSARWRLNEVNAERRSSRSAKLQIIHVENAA